MSFPIEVKIPIRGYLKRYVERKYRVSVDPYVLSEKTVFGKFVSMILTGASVTNYRLAKSSKNFDDVIAISVLPEIANAGRFYLTERSVAKLDAFLLADFKEEFARWILVSEKQKLDHNITAKNFMAYHNVGDEVVADHLLRDFRRNYGNKESRNSLKGQINLTEHF